MDGTPIAFEVYAPDDSQASQDQSALADALRQAVMEAISDSLVEIDVLQGFNKSEIPAAVQTILNAPPSLWTPVGDWAQIRRTDQGQPLAPTFDGSGAEVRVAGNTEVKGLGKSVVVRWEHADTRARLALERKRAQVDDAIANVVVMDVCAVGRVGEWPEIIASLPGIEFSKVGMVVFFDQGSLGPPERIRRRWPSLKIPMRHCKSQRR